MFFKKGLSSDNAGSTTKGKKGTLSTTAPGFADKALEQGMLDPKLSKPPSNLKNLEVSLNTRRGSSDPSLEERETFVRDIEKAPNEATVVTKFSSVFKRHKEKDYSNVYNQPCTRFPANVGFNNGLSPAQPDFMEGHERTAFHPFPVVDKLGNKGAVLYDGRAAVTLPHLAGEFKGPSGSMETAKVQAAYDGATLVFARNQALNYLQPSKEAERDAVNSGARQLPRDRRRG